jgi:hypothetical protein
MGIENKETPKQDATPADGVTQAEKAGLNTQASKDAPGVTAAAATGAKHADEPAGMEDVPKGASQAYRTEYANVIRDFHGDKLRNNKSQIVRDLPQAKILAAAQANKIDPLSTSSQVS